MVLSFMEDNSRRQWRRSLETATMVESFVSGRLLTPPVCFFLTFSLTCSLLFRSRGEAWDATYVARTPMLNHLLLFPRVDSPQRRDAPYALPCLRGKAGGGRRRAWRKAKDIRLAQTVVRCFDLGNTNANTNRVRESVEGSPSRGVLGARTFGRFRMLDCFKNRIWGSNLSTVVVPG
jgi:hypothetical protein